MVFNAGGSGRVWPSRWWTAVGRSIGWRLTGWTDREKRNAAERLDDEDSYVVPTVAIDASEEVMEGWHNVLECPISERASFYIKLTPVAGRFGFSVVQSLGCRRTAGSVRFLSFFFPLPPPPKPREARGGRTVARSVSIGGPRALSLVNRSWVRTMSGRRSCGTRSPWRKAKERRKRSERWTRNECSIGHRRAEGGRTRTRGGIPGDRLAASASGPRSARAQV